MTDILLYSADRCLRWEKIHHFWRYIWSSGISLLNQNQLVRFLVFKNITAVNERSKWLFSLDFAESQKRIWWKVISLWKLWTNQILCHFCVFKNHIWNPMKASLKCYYFLFLFLFFFIVPNSYICWPKEIHVIASELDLGLYYYLYKLKYVEHFFFSFVSCRSNFWFNSHQF